MIDKIEEFFNEREDYLFKQLTDLLNYNKKWENKLI
jgi:hypothetical protein